ncbi:MFS general substrate transporter [Basidiobolus meristosporus CBS 931.73]|uniref:MFS general substrate transporter n=1 Tax=Basidiobolus meristosporus CBS 931.73 TaxID=1314790 RepID=A0A1Y1Z6R3_9FUNG|nr:MFS general substrate transporter [Basidiobolus meristosporus CBS 931.73]|eukprot:ORY05949.1 MFS general substrate transporter [Basidiobolus meristosporus CBS 931.73]
MDSSENQNSLTFLQNPNDSRSASTLVVEPDVTKSQDNEKAVVELDETYPEGGRGWLVVLGGHLIHVVAFGIQTTFGIFQEHYTNVVFAGSSPSTISLIGTIGAGVLAFSTLITGNLADRFGYRTTITIGCCILVAGLIIASFCTQIWQLILTQGVLYGMGASLCYPPAISAPPQWFNKKRGLATGMTVAGSGIGGLILSPITQVLIDKLGFRWALRVLALFALLFLLIASLLVKRRIFPKKHTEKDSQGYSFFKTLRFWIFFGTGLFTGFSYLVPFFYMPSYAVFVGLSVNQGAMLVACANAASAAGRIGTGFIADKLGCMNVLGISLFMAGAFSFLWMFTTTVAPLIIYMVVFGFLGGAFPSQFPVVTALLFGTENLATVAGALYASTAIGDCLGAFIAGALYDMTAPHYTYHWSILYVAIGMFLCSVTVAILKYNKYRTLRGLL